MVESNLKKTVRSQVDPRWIRPLRDGLLAGLGVWLSLLAGVWWIYHQAWQSTLFQHGETVESTARWAAETVDPTVLVVEFLPPESRSVSRKVMRSLAVLDEESSPVGRVTVLKPVDGAFRILYDTSDPTNHEGWREPRSARIVAPSEVEIVEDVLRAGEERHLTRADGTMKSYVPIGAEETLAVATAESTRQTLRESRTAILRALWSAVLLGGIVALFVGGIVSSVRRKMRRALWQARRAERADRMVLNTMGQIFYEWDPVTDAIRWRGNVPDLLGVEAGAISSGADWMRRIHKADRDEFLRLRKIRPADGEHDRMEYRVHREDGKWIWVMDRGRRLPESEGRGGLSIGVILNMTASREAEQRLRDVVDAAGEFIWEVGADGRYIYLSGRVEDVLGRTPEELLGADLFAHVPEEDVEEVRRAWAVLADKEEAFRDFEHRILRADGKSIWLRINGVPSFDANGVWSGYRGAGLEVTDRKEAEQALIREKEAANAAARAKTQFLAMMSHEIRTPLNSVLGFADLLSATSLDPEQREQIEVIRKSGDALLVLLNDILDFSRIESDGLALDVTAVDLPASLRDAVDLYRLAAKQRQIDLRLEIAPGVPRFLRTDQARLRQILLNLVGNAVKFTEKGSVTVRAALEKEPIDGPASVRIEVEDTGIGIPAEKVPSLFHPFVQVDASATRRFGGTGLGLAICRRLAELLGGEVGLQRSDEKGSTFFLILNGEVADGGKVEGNGDSARQQPLPQPTGRKDRRILVVEDNRINRLLVRKMLDSIGVASREAENGLECLQIQAEDAHDLILMDVQMPVLDGLEASRKIRRQEQSDPEKKRTTIVALTADAMVGDRARCLAAGMDDYLSKPVRMEALVTMLNRHGILTEEAAASGDEAGGT